MENFPAYVIQKSIIDSLERLRRDRFICQINPHHDRHILQVVPRGREEVAEAGRELVVGMVDALRHLQPYRSTSPSRNRINQRYSKELYRNVLNDGTYTNRLVIGPLRLEMMIHTLSQIIILCEKNEKLTITGLYYTGKIVYRRDKSLCVSCILDLCCLLRCTRASLQLYSSDAGRIIGPLGFAYGYPNNIIICMGIDGVYVPRDIEIVGQMNSTARFILLVEKDSIFARLASNGFHILYPCIMITGRGHAGLTTKRFLQMISRQLDLPVLGLFDGDISGFMILCSYIFGSKNMSFDNQNLVTPDIKWLGLRPSDIERHNIPDYVVEKMSEKDLNLAKEWVTKPFLQTRTKRRWVTELQTMIATKRCANLESLNAIRMNYLIEEFLPRKLNEKCWM